MVEVVWSKRALKHLTKIDSRYRKVINEKTQQLVTFPLVTLDIKKLQDTDNQYRLWVGDYRVIFELIEGEPVVLRIEEVTRRTSRTYWYKAERPAIMLHDINRDAKTPG